MPRILLVDDDIEFRESVEQSLQTDGHEVICADNGRKADKLLAGGGFDLMIADLEMPEMTGLELIQAARARKETTHLPIILITGFSELLETREAHEIGANEFLTKPFHRAELNGMIRRLLGETSAPAEDSGAFCRLGIEDFANGRKIKFNIFIRVAATRYVKVAHKGEDIKPERLKAYKKKGLDFLFLRQEDFRKYVGFALDLEFAVEDGQDRKKKVNLMRDSARTLTEDIRHDGIDHHVYAGAAAFVEASLELLTDDRRALNLLERLRHRADRALTHSLGVSVYSALIGQRVQWNLPPNRFKLAVGGLLRDIGQQPIRCMLSHDLLENLKALPDDVQMIIKQRHENGATAGVPQKVKKTAIYPMARLIAVADDFCRRVIAPHGVTPMAALQDMTATYSQTLDKEFLTALVEVFTQSELKLNGA